MKAIVGIFYETLEKAQQRAEALKRMWKGRVAFVVVGNEKGYLVISESSARACGIKVPLKARRYGITNK